MSKHTHINTYTIFKNLKSYFWSFEKCGDRGGSGGAVGVWRGQKSAWIVHSASSTGAWSEDRVCTRSGAGFRVPRPADPGQSAFQVHPRSIWRNQSLHEPGHLSVSSTRRRGRKVGRVKCELLSRRVWRLSKHWQCHSYIIRSTILSPERGRHSDTQGSRLFRLSQVQSKILTQHTQKMSVILRLISLVNMLCRKSNANLR